MAKPGVTKRTKRKKRHSRSASKALDLLRPEESTKEIIKRLQSIGAIAGTRPSVVFDHWLEIVDATLEALPDQVKAVLQTGQLAPDPPEVAEVFERVRAYYDDDRLGIDRCRRIWQNFSEAFAYLLASAAPGLWGEVNYGQIGPDLVGHIYQIYANLDPSWQAQYMSPWPVAQLMAALTIQNGEAQVHQRLKQALTHPDNHLGAAVLMTSLAIPDDEPDQAWDWFITRVVPAALPFYVPIRFLEPAIGSGRLMLAAAARFPQWAVAGRLVTFAGQDVDFSAILMSRINSKLYGLNGYALKLTAAVAEGLEARQQPAENLPPISMAEALVTTKHVVQVTAAPTALSEDRLSFERLFRTAVLDMPAAET
jgi:hypothetical protein